MKRTFFRKEIVVAEYFDGSAEVCRRWHIVDLGETKLGFPRYYWITKKGTLIKAPIESGRWLVQDEDGIVRVFDDHTFREKYSVCR